MSSEDAAVHGIASNGPNVRLRGWAVFSPRERVKRIERVKLYPTASRARVSRYV